MSISIRVGLTQAPAQAKQSFISLDDALQVAIATDATMRPCASKKRIYFRGEPADGGTDADIQQPTQPTLSARIGNVNWVVPAIGIPIPRLRTAGIACQRVGGAEGSGAGVVVARHF